MRFNRGGMSRAELIAKLREQEANFLIIVTMYKGNPNNLEIIHPEGKTLATIFMESAMLRREVLNSHYPRINNVHSVEVKQNSTLQTKELAYLIGSLLNTNVMESIGVKKVGPKSSVTIWFQDSGRGKSLWTHYHAIDGTELGPRIRVSSLSRSIEK
jgi:rRNA maturation protein Rpf1